MIRGLVLAGGKSSRFGSDKTQATYQGMSLLDRAVMLLGELDLKPVVATRKEAGTSSMKCVTIYDKLPEKGPLGGIYTGMTIFKNVSFLVLTCDMPAIKKEVLLELLEAHEKSRTITLFSLGGIQEPFPGIYEASLYPQIRAHLLSNDLSMGKLLETCPHRKILDWEGDPAAFNNVNFKKDLPLPAY